MSERLPYEDSLKQKLQEIPLPEQEPSWQKMKALLKEDDDDKVVPPFFTGCGIIGLILLILAGGFWFYTSQQKNKSKKEPAVYSASKEKNSAAKLSDQKNSNGSSQTQSDNSTASEIRNDNSSVQNETGSADQTTLIMDSGKMKYSSNRSVNHSPNSSALNSGTNKSVNQVQNNTASTVIKNKKRTTVKSGSKTKMNLNTSNGNEIVEEKTYPVQRKASRKQTIPAQTKMVVSVAEEKDSVHIINVDSAVVIKIDSAMKPTDLIPEKTDSIQKADSTKPASLNKEKKKSKYYFAAGLSLQHQLPINGQHSNNYDAYGRKNSLKDYIPAPYIRFYKENKWFIHTGFRYGAPQSLKEVAYKSTETLDTAAGQIVTNRSNFIARKTFYHQIPLSFNYLITKNVSVGTGIMYSLFNGALTEKQSTVSVNRQGVDSVISSTKEFVNVPSSGDSSFTRTQFNWTMQAEFHWKRFGFGTVYTKGLQPFLKYVEAGVAKTQKNESLQIFIRYQLWKQKKK